MLNGEVPLGGFELPASDWRGGYQRRDDSYTNILLVEIAGDTWIGSDQKETLTSGDRTVDAYFAELSIPILSTLRFRPRCVVKSLNWAVFD